MNRSSTHIVKEAATSVTEVAKEGADVVKDSVDHLIKQSTQQARLMEKRIKKNPLAAVAIAAGVGAVFAGILGRFARLSRA